MAARARITPRLLLRLLLALVVVVAAVFVIRRLTERPIPPRDLFPYGELRVGVDPSSPPFAAFAEDGSLFGQEIDLAHALGTQLDLPVRFVPLGFDGLYDALKTDQADALIASLSIDLTRLRDVHYSQPYFNAGLVLVSENEIRQMEDLPGHSVAYEFGSEADSEARTWLRRILAFETRPYERPTDALDAARLGDADAALVDSVSARLYLRDRPEWQPHTRVVTDNLYAVATQSRRPEISVAIHDALQTLMDDGTLEKLIAQWM
ncbi:MAG: ABC transporter substrate-binding protein [Chloroflexota bacterium]